MSRPELLREAGSRILGAPGASSSPDDPRMPARTAGPVGHNDCFAHPEGHDGGLTAFHRRQRRLSDHWESFGSIVKEYLGIPYNSRPVRPGQRGGGRAVTGLTGKAMGVATPEVGLVCTSFVDVVLSRYVFDGPGDQLDEYSLKGHDPHSDADDFTDIFNKRGLRRLHRDVEPDALEDLGLDQRGVYGIAFYSRDGYEKHGRRRPPGSVFHVGFLAFHNDHLFLVHASGPKGVHIVAWARFLRACGTRHHLERFAAGSVPGAKFVGVYALSPRPHPRRP